MRIEGISQPPGEGETEEEKRRKKEREERENRRSDKAEDKRPRGLGFLAVESDEPDKPAKPSFMAEAWARIKGEPERAEAPSRERDVRPKPPLSEYFVAATAEESAPASDSEDDSRPVPVHESAPPDPPAPEPAPPVRPEAAPPPVNQDQVEVAPSAAEDESPDPAPETPRPEPEVVRLEPETTRDEAEPAPEPLRSAEAPPDLPAPEPAPVETPRPEPIARPEAPPAIEPSIEEEPAPDLATESAHGPDAGRSDDGAETEPRGSDEEEPRLRHDRTAEEPMHIHIPAEEADAPARTEEPAPDRPEPHVEEPTRAKPFEFVEEGDSDEETPPPAAEQADDAPDTERRAPERLGHMLVDNEATGADEHAMPRSNETATAPETSKSSRAAEQRMKIESAPKGPLAGRRVETLNRTELMDAAKDIYIENTNLLQIYETHLIGERGLRRLLIEYQNGGDMAEALKREVMEHEKDFERDPALRTLAPSSVAGQDGSDDSPIGDSVTLEKLLKKVVPGAVSEQKATASTAPHAEYPVESDGDRRKRLRALADAAFFAVIGILIALVIIVYLRRG